MTMEVEVEGSSCAVPDNVLDSVKKTLINVQEINANFDEFLSLSDPEVLAELPPLQRAQSLLTLARLTTGLFALRLRCAGVHPQEHRVKGEMERISLYQGKLERYSNLSKAPVRPSTKLNSQAATRVIQHSLPHLTNEQRQSFKDLSKNVSGRISYVNRDMQKKRKYESPEKKDKPSVQAAAQAFLEKAALELLGGEQELHKGPMAPILIEDSSDDEEFEEEQEEIEVLEVKDDEQEDGDNDGIAEDEDKKIGDEENAGDCSASAPEVIDISD